MLSDLARWLPDLWGRLERGNLHCTFRHYSYGMLRTYHDALKSFVQNDTIPFDIRNRANAEAGAATTARFGHYTDMPEESKEDAAACCRIAAKAIAEGRLIPFSGGMPRNCAQF
jgi:hypothetical protein